MTVEEKKERISNLRKFHEPAFKVIGVEDPLYIPRMAYRPTGHNEVVISFFASELKNEKDIYTEFVSRDYESEDPNRVLWKWKYNPYWSTEYATSDTTDALPNSVKYYIPTSELIVISRNGVVKTDKLKEIKEDIEKPKIDLTAMLKKPTLDSEFREKSRSEDNILDIPIKDLTLRQLRDILNKL
jgi:hypothetical protein